MGYCSLSLLALTLLLTQTVTRLSAQHEMIDIDNEEERRVPRQVSEGSGMWDYNVVRKHPHDLHRFGRQKRHLFLWFLY